MKVIHRLIHSDFVIKVRHWEHWPWYIVYIPVFLYWLYLGLRARSIFFFSASNPGIKYGGMVGESKNRILNKIPPQYIPKTLLISQEGSENVESKMQKAGLTYPVIMKPDIGERGWKVQKINNETQGDKYINDVKGDIIIQEYIDLPFEAGVFYYRMPNEKKGTISSIVVKELLKVIGDGTSTIEELVLSSDRAKLQLETLRQTLGKGFLKIPKEGEEIGLQPIGNHNLGTAFLSGNHLINDDLTKQFDKLCLQIEGFYYGRFDLRCADADALYNSQFKIMELNGAASEPAHIYHPGSSLLKAYKVLFHHWKVLYRISKQNHERGIKYITFKTGIKALKMSGRISEQGI